MLDKPGNLNQQHSPKVELNHLIILAKEKQRTADFITNLLDLPNAVSGDGSVPNFFLCIQFANDIMILIAETKEHSIGHYAFKVTNEHFERIVNKLKIEKTDFWADPRMQRPFECYEEEGNKGKYRKLD